MAHRKGIYFTSDWHLFHENSISFDERPFKDVDHMHRVLINNYNSTVKEDDVCYFLGDVGFATPELITSVIKQLNGTKVLILGNHDRNAYSMYSQGFDVVMNAGVFYIASNRISMSHCPLPGIYREDCSEFKGQPEGNKWHGEHKNQMFTSQDLTVDFHLHGHIHSNPKHSDPEKKAKEKFTDRQYDVGAPANNFRPVSISEIESWISLTKKEKSEKNETKTV